MNPVFKATSAAVGLVLAFSANAAPISPTFTTFGLLAGVTFGGSGIPNSPAAIFNLTDPLTGQTTLTMGLIATPRFTGVVTNDGAGTYSSVTGISPNPPSSLADPYAMWNFSSYVGGSAASGLFFRLFYDFDPAVGTNEADHGTVSFAGTTLVLSPNGSSSNLGFNSLATSGVATFGPHSFTTVTPTGTFDPNAAGQYTFALRAYRDANFTDLVGSTAIAVNVVPEPGTFALAGLALLGLATARRRA